MAFTWKGYKNTLPKAVADDEKLLKMFNIHYSMKACGLVPSSIGDKIDEQDEQVGRRTVADETLIINHFKDKCKLLMTYRDPNNDHKKYVLRAHLTNRGQGYLVVLENYKEQDSDSCKVDMSVSDEKDSNVAGLVDRIRKGP